MTKECIEVTPNSNILMGPLGSGRHGANSRELMSRADAEALGYSIKRIASAPVERSPGVERQRQWELANPGKRYWAHHHGSGQPKLAPIAVPKPATPMPTMTAAEIGDLGKQTISPELQTRLDQRVWECAVRSLPEAKNRPVTTERLLFAYGPKSKSVAKCQRLLASVPEETAPVALPRRASRTSPDAAEIMLRRRLELAQAALQHRVDRGDRSARTDLQTLSYVLAHNLETEEPITAIMSNLGLDPSTYVKG